MAVKKRPLPIPLPLLVGNALGMTLLAGGLTGLFAPESMPALTRPAVAYALMGVGLTLEAATLFGMLKAERARATLPR